jgi:hypothetical protein
MARSFIANRRVRCVCGLLFTMAIALFAQMAVAQVSATAPVGSINPNPDFFGITTPGRFSLTLFGGGFLSDQYATTQQGIQVEQTLTQYVGIVGRATGYQLFEGQGFANPLSPNPGSTWSSRSNFGRFQGGIDLALNPTTHVYVLGGDDGGDSHKPNVEGDISSWLLEKSAHPLNFLVSSVHSWQNDISSSSIDLRAVLMSTESYMLMAGGGGAIYGGGFVSGVAGQGGPDLGIYYRPWQIGFDAQAGYGSPHGYGQLSLYKQFNWLE